MRVPSKFWWLAGMTTLSVFSLFCGGTVIDNRVSGAGATSATGPGSSTGSEPPSFGACSAAGTCVLVPHLCCAVCGQPQLPDVDAVAASSVAADSQSKCGANSACPKCATQVAPNLFAYCDLNAGTCQKADVAGTAYSQCTVAEDCQLRNGLGCCTCTGQDSWVGIAKATASDLEKVLCEQGQACAECAAVPPPGLVAQCDQGHCAARLPP